MAVRDETRNCGDYDCYVMALNFFLYWRLSRKDVRMLFFLKGEDFFYALISNMTQCGGAIKIFFPASIPHPTPAFNDDPGAITIQSIPTLATLTTCLVVLSWGRSRVSGKGVRCTTLLLALSVVAVQTLLIQRGFELVECDSITKLSVSSWALLCTIAIAFCNVAILLFVMPRCAPAATIFYLTCSGATVFLEWTLRGGFETTDGAYPLAAIQQSFAMLAISSLYHFKADRRSRRTAPQRETVKNAWTTARLAASDPLETTTTTLPTTTQGINWFVV